MVKPKIIENKRVNKGYFRVVLEFEDDLVGAYCNDDGIDKIVKLNENGEDVDFDNLDERNDYDKKYLSIIREMEANYEIGLYQNR